MSCTHQIVQITINYFRELRSEIVERRIRSYEDFQTKLKAKVFMFYLICQILYLLVLLIWQDRSEFGYLIFIVFVIVLELKLLRRYKSSHVSGTILLLTLLYTGIYGADENKNSLKNIILLAYYPILGSIFISSKQLYLLSFFWISMIFAHYQSPPISIQDCRMKHEQDFYKLMVVSVFGTAVTRMGASQTEIETVYAQTKNEELKKSNQELLQERDRAINFIQELRITIQKLEESNRNLEQAVHAKRNFITKVSDELRNPLNSIMGNLELLEDQITDPEQHEKLVNIKWSADLLLQMTNNVIDASKLQVGRIEINKQKTSVLKTCERLWALNFQKIRQKKIRGLLYLSKSVPKYLVIDEEKVLEICHNLLTNSVKYTEKGNIRIFVSWHPQLQTLSKMGHQENFFSLQTFCDVAQTAVPNSAAFESLEITDNLSEILTRENEEHLLQLAPGISSMTSCDEMEATTHYKINSIPKSSLINKKEFLVLNTEQSLFKNTAYEFSPLNTIQKGDLKIEIVDSGNGMDSSIFPSLYKSIFQRDSKITQQLGGKGLGLYVSSELAKLMDGQIKYFSKKGAGTSIIIRIPCETPVQIESSKAFLRHLSVMTLDTKKIALIVDDEKMNREILTSYLRKLNIYALHAENGQEAVKLVKDKPEGYFCFATMDIQMPIMNGIEACREIRSLELMEARKRKLKIVVITANCTEQDKDEVMNPKKACKANYFYRKPLMMSDCQSFVQEILGRPANS